MDKFLIQQAKRIPKPIRQKIIDEGLIDKAFNIQEPGTSMEYLFDVYEEFIDLSGEHDDWTCWQCREFVLQEFRKLKPHLNVD
ncbi:MAG: hypothetical protein LC112_13975 [Flavobacteriales bacterium]|nr:hypothetical protein [Flavobacteriales bacterium]